MQWDIALATKDRLLCAISPYTVKERMTYNNLLMGIVEDPNPTAKIVKVKTVKQSLLDKMENFSEEEIRDALIMMKKRELESLMAL